MLPRRALGADGTAPSICRHGRRRSLLSAVCPPRYYHDVLAPHDFIDSLAQAATRRGLTVPAIFTLEMYKPLVSLGHAGAMLSAPLLIPLFGMSMYQNALKLLESREHVEILIQRLETLAEAR